MDSKKYSVGLNRKILSIYLSIGIGIFAIYKAFIQHWVCDDAFISFRYAKNLTDGLGLVYNAREFVEGYTNFLWTIFLSVGMFFHLDPIHVSAGLGILFYFLTLFVLYKTGTTAYEIRAGKRYKSFYFPIAFAGFALHSHGQIFATGGLETSLFSFLLLAGTVFLLLSNRGLHLLTGFFLLVLAIMTRPDGALDILITKHILQISLLFNFLLFLFFCLIGSGVIRISVGFFPILFTRNQEWEPT